MGDPQRHDYHQSAPQSADERHYSWEFNPWIYPRVFRSGGKEGRAFKAVSVLLLAIGLLNIVIACLHIAVPTALAGTDAVNLTGTVVDSNQHPLSEVNITIVGKDIHVATDRTGGFTVYDLQAGELAIQANKSGYRNMTQTFYLVRDLSDSIRFVLSEGRGDVETNENDMRISVYGSSILILIFAAFALVGASYIDERRHFSVAVSASILGCMNLIFIDDILFINIMLLLAFCLSLISLFILIRIRKHIDTEDGKEFERTEEKDRNRREVRPGGSERHAEVPRL